MEDADWNLFDRHVVGVIYLTLMKNVANNMVQVKATIEMMNTLSHMYEKLSTNNMVYIMEKLFNMKMGEGTLAATYFNISNTIISQLTSVEINFNDKVSALIILMSLPKIWEPIRVRIRNSISKRKLKLNDAKDHILTEEARRVYSGEGTLSTSA